MFWHRAHTLAPTHSTSSTCPWRILMLSLHILHTLVLQLRFVVLFNILHLHRRKLLLRLNFFKLFCSYASTWFVVAFICVECHAPFTSAISLALVAAAHSLSPARMSLVPHFASFTCIDVSGANVSPAFLHRWLRFNIFHCHLRAMMRSVSVFYSKSIWIRRRGCTAHIFPSTSHACVCTHAKFRFGYLCPLVFQCVHLSVLFRVLPVSWNQWKKSTRKGKRVEWKR